MNAVTHREPGLTVNRDPFRVVRATSRAAYLDLRVHLINGKSARFVQTDTAAATRLIAQIRPERAFALSHLTIADSGSTTTFPTDVIERLDFLTTPAPAWQPAAATIREVTDTTRHAPDLDALRCQAELFSGRTVDLDVKLRGQDSPLLPVDLSLFLTRLFSGKSVVGACEGGLFLLNPANIMRVDSHSAEAVIDSHSLKARQIREPRIALR